MVAHEAPRAAEAGAASYIAKSESSPDRLAQGLGRLSARRLKRAEGACEEGYDLKHPPNIPATRPTSWSSANTDLLLPPYTANASSDLPPRFQCSDRPAGFGQEAWVLPNSSLCHGADMVEVAPLVRPAVGGSKAYPNGPRRPPYSER